MKHTTRLVSSGMRRTARALLFFIFLTAAGCGDSSPHIVPMPPGAVILAFGDSLTSGYGADLAEFEVERDRKIAAETGATVSIARRRFRLPVPNVPQTGFGE